MLGTGLARTGTNTGTEIELRKGGHTARFTGKEVCRENPIFAIRTLAAKQNFFVCFRLDLSALSAKGGVTTVE